MPTSFQRNRNTLVILTLVAAPAALWRAHTDPVPVVYGESEARDPFLIQKVAPHNIRYVAVGDSYTCGTGASMKQSWPLVLTNHLRAHGVRIGLAANLGVAGWTTQQALDVETPVFREQKPDFATLMIGVNDTYRTTTPLDFQSQLDSLIGQMQSVLPDKSQILVVTIPDFTVTPGGAEYASGGRGQARVIAFNKIIQTEAAKHGLPVVDVFALSQQMGVSQELQGPDRLHPSAKEYALWERAIYPAANALLHKSLHRP